MVQTRLFSTCIRIAALCSTNLFLILTLCSAALGQGSTPQRGFQPGASYALSDIETINTTNGNLSLHLPLGQLPAGRGGSSGRLNLHYDSKIYDSQTQWYQDWDHIVFGEPHVVTRNMLVTSNEGGWHYGTGYGLQLIDRMYQYPPELAPQYPAQETIYHYKVKVAFPDGSLHEFMPRVGSMIDQGYSDIRPDGFQSRYIGGYVQDVPYLTNNMIYYTFDGTYIRLEVQHDSDSNPWNNPWTLSFPDGTRVTNFGSRITDRNGNYVEFSSTTYNGHLATQLMDQLGRKIIIEYGGVSGGDVIHVPGVGGADLTYQVYWKGIQVFKTYSTITTYDRYSPDGYPDMLGSQFVVSRIDLPAATGGLQYVFGYNAADSGSTPCCTPSYGWGELNSVTTPTGAQAQYQYQLDGQDGPGWPYTWDNVLRNQVTQKTLTYQQQYDGTSTPISETWTYGLGQIINPDGGIVTQWNDPQRNYRTEYPDGTVVEKLWAANRTQNFSSTAAYDEYTGIDAYDPSRVNGYVKTEFTSVKNASGTLIKTAIKDYNYDKNGNVTAIREYDWVDYGTVPRTNGFPTGIPAGAVVKRVTTNTMAFSTPDASDYTSNHANSYWTATAPTLRNAVAVTEVSNGSTTLSRTELTYDNAGTTGNLTQQKSWDSTKGAYSNPLITGNSISVANQYDSYGNPTLSTDARGYQTQFVYGSIGGFTDLYPTQTKTAYQTSVQRTETREYDFSTGLVTRTTDVDNNVSTSTSYDVFGRPALVKAAEGKPEETRTSTSYSDANRRVIVKSDLNTAGDEKLVSVQHYDQLGRLRLTRLLEDAATQSATDETTGIKVQTRYRYSGNFSYVLSSNPYRAATSGAAGSESTMGWSRTKSNNGGQVIEVQAFAGASAPEPWGTNSSSTGTTSTAYDGEFTSVTDQAGKLRRSMLNGLGQIIRVDEPDATGSLGDKSSATQATSYTYDALANLTQVLQGSQTRTFVFSSLKRLTSSINPESGTISYVYDNNGNLLTKTDPRNTTTFVYDALNRITTRSYSDSTPTVTYVYDAVGVANSKGRPTSVSSSVSATNYTAYDPLGRVKNANQVTDGQTYSLSYSYNLAGNLTSLTYPSGRVIETRYDSAGRVVGVKDQQSGIYYAGAVESDATNRMQYAANGAVQVMKLGNGLWEHTDFNSRLQTTQIGLGTSSTDSSTLGLTYNYGSTNNNGNLLSIAYTGGGLSYSQTFAYDELNRLTTSAESGGSWSQTNKYDRYGNRAIDLGGGNQSLYFNAANNRITNSGYVYDGAGNLTSDGTQSYGYDAENKIKSVGGESDVYRYDSDGNRVRKNFIGGEKVRMVYSGSQLIAEYALSNGALAKEYIYCAKGLLATIEPASGIKYTTADLLDSPRVITGSTGSVLSRHDYKPFGEEIGAGIGGRNTGIGFGVSDGLRQHFTSKERDFETGLDYFGARYFASVQGRFTTVDPIKFAPSRMYEPQAINLYVYCANNPLINVDADGRYYVGKDGKKVQVTETGGKVQVGKNASDALKRYAALVNQSESSESVASMLKVASNATKVHLQFSQEVKYDKGDLVFGLHQAHDKKGKALDWDDDTGKFKGKAAFTTANGETQYKEATITIYEGSINKNLGYFGKLSNDPTVTVAEAMVIVGSHENTHDTDKASIKAVKDRQEGKTNPLNVEQPAVEVMRKVADEIKDNKQKKKENQ